MKGDISYIEIYKRSEKGFNYRLIEESSFGKKIIHSTRQCYVNRAECVRIAKKYHNPSLEVKVLSKYYRIK